MDIYAVYNMHFHVGLVYIQGSWKVQLRQRPKNMRCPPKVSSEEGVHQNKSSDHDTNASESGSASIYTQCVGIALIILSVD